MLLVRVRRASRWLNASSRPPSLTFLWAAGGTLFLALYTMIFATFSPGMTLGSAAVVALTNVLPLVALAAVVRALLKTYVMPLGSVAQGLIHLALAPAFATLWYLSVVVIQSLMSARAGGAVVLTGFNAMALVWQAFQGLVIYALIASVCYAVRGGREAAPVSFIETPPALERYLIRAGDEFVPIVVGDIVSISGAQDYSEVSIAGGRRHLVRLSLGEFERRLDPQRFVRVHRSTIINLEQVERVEPAGNGRMTAHLDDGQSIEVSRTGAQALRRFVV